MEPSVVYTAAEKAHCYVDANQPIANVMRGQDEWGEEMLPNVLVGPVSYDSRTP